MIDITNCNKIIVDTIGKTEKIIEWYQQNKDWLDAEEFRIPIPSALVELPECKFDNNLEILLLCRF